jgi:hypothetical protein
MTKPRKKQKQDRRSVSLRLQVYNTLATHCARTGKSMSSFVEDLILREVRPHGVLAPVAEPPTVLEDALEQEDPPPQDHVSDHVEGDPPAILFLG